MLEIEPSPEQASLLNRFSGAGGVVDFLFFTCTEHTEDVEAEATHREAVVAGLYALQSRRGAYSKILSLKPRVVRESVWRIQITSSKLPCLAGERISTSQFLGERYDQRGGGLLLGGSDPLPSDGDCSRPGFAYAFSDPPYRLRLPAREIGELFEQITSAVLGGLADDAIIYEWPTDWSSYFDAGREWWGSFLWSVGFSKANSIVVIAASTSD